MDSISFVAVASIVIAGMTMAIGSYGPSQSMGQAIQQALAAIAQQPDERNSLTRTLFVGLAMIESIAIYCFVISMIVIFANPFWGYFIKAGG